MSYMLLEGKCLDTQHEVGYSPAKNGKTGCTFTHIKY